jgi:hypothetical protein
MRKLDGITWVCSKHTGERTRIMLDTLNAHARPPQTWPVRDPKPQNPLYPNSLEADEGDLFNFVAQQITARARYERVISGSAPYATDIVLTMAWSARYLYDLIQQGTRTIMIAKAKVLLAACADYILSRQYGSLTGPLSSATRAGNAFYGGVLESGATSFVTNDNAASGLALLYAYRILGTGTYIVGARAAASYLRNVQAIGSNGTQHTSLDFAGTSRLYTGAVCSQVSTTSGVDPGQNFYSDHAFYPSGLIALELWNELKTTDGDQSIGATTAVNGFDTTPAQLMSQSIADMRACWANGIQTATTAVVNGFSTTTPSEFFNAYPALKTGFTFSGTGLWEFEDGSASTGTMITGENFAIALGSLYAYEGQSTQVNAIFDWLATFESNVDFKTPDNTSPSVLARTTTGVYDPTICIASLLQVRDPNASYAAIAQNGSSLYDWGAYGAMARPWAARNLTTFQNGRVKALNIQPRFDDGKPTDGQYWDRIQLRGYSGLSFQSAFAVDADGTPSSLGSTAVTTPPSVGLIFWVKGDKGLESAAGVATAWRDQSGFGQDVTDLPANPGPFTGIRTIDGIPAATYSPIVGTNYGLYRAAGLRDRNGNFFGYGTGETQARTVIAVLRPKFEPTVFNVTGGIVAEFGGTPTFQPCFDLTSVTYANAFYGFSTGGAPVTADPGATRAPDAPGGLSGPYNGAVVFAEWSSTGFDNIEFRVNGVLMAPLRPPTIPGVPANNSNHIFSLGRASSGGFSFYEDISEALVWDHALDDTERAQANAYISNRYSSFANPVLTVNDAYRASQFGRTFREAH